MKQLKHKLNTNNFRYFKLFIFFITCFNSHLILSQCNNVALDFDGVNDYINIPLTQSYSEFTISAWFNATSNVNGQWEDRIFSLREPRLEIGLEDSNDNSSDEGKLWINDGGSGGTNVKIFNTPNLHDDQWHQVVFSKIGDQRNIFLDGVLIESWVATDISYGSAPFQIGQWPYGVPNGSSFKGQIDDVAFFTTALPNTTIQGLYTTGISPNDPSLGGYWKFENGIPGGNNTSNSIVPNLSTSGNLNIGFLVDFGLMNMTSNFVCRESVCNSSCDTTTIDISTGKVFNLDATIPTNEHQVNWKVVGTPANSNVNPGHFAYVVPTPSAWADIPGAKYVSPFPVIQNSFNNIGTNTSFDFETCFCVCDDDSDITIDMSAYSDNNVDMDLYQGDVTDPANFIMDLLDITDTSTGAFNYPTTDSTHTVNLDQGQYCIKSALQNDGSVYMGLSARILLSGAGLITSECCLSTNGITGYVWSDLDCNSQNGGLSETPLAGIDMELCDSQGATLETATTDALGLYTFSDLPVGNYTIKYVPTSDYVLVSAPFMPISLNNNQVIGNQNYGLNYTGPLETGELSTSCVASGDTFVFDWTGQECDCDIELYFRTCNSNDDYELIADTDNTRSYAWQVPSNLNGDFEFMIKDCDGNEIPYEGCMEVGDFSLDIKVQQTDCGTYLFTSSLLNSTGTSIPISSQYWTFGDLLNSSSSKPLHEYSEAGTYTVCVSVIGSDGCRLNDCIDLQVNEGADEDCNFCPPHVLSEIEQGDLYIYDECFGLIIKSPSGSCFRIKVSDEGTIFGQAIACPDQTGGASSQ